MFRCLTVRRKKITLNSYFSKNIFRFLEKTCVIPLNTSMNNLTVNSFRLSTVRSLDQWDHAYTITTPASKSINEGCDG